MTSRSCQELEADSKNTREGDLCEHHGGKGCCGKFTTAQSEEWVDWPDRKSYEWNTEYDAFGDEEFEVGIVKNICIPIRLSEACRQYNQSRMAN